MTPRSDAIRGALLDLGVEVQDGPDGPSESLGFREGPQVSKSRRTAVLSPSDAGFQPKLTFP
jgi:hypothetical protein